MVEGRVNIIKIQNATAEVLKQLLRFIYCCETEDEFKDYRALMIIADKYQVEDLKKHCSSKILEKINPKNAIEIGQFGETHNCQELVQGIAKYIVRLNPSNRSKVLSGDWKNRMEKFPKMTFALIEHFHIIKS